MRGEDDKRGINQAGELAAAVLVKLPCCFMPVYTTAAARLVALGRILLTQSLCS